MPQSYKSVYVMERGWVVFCWQAVLLARAVSRPCTIKSSDTPSTPSSPSLPGSALRDSLPAIAGFKIRHFVTGLVGAEHVLQAYVPAVHGKEARKQAPGKEGLLGVEGIADDLILQGLQTALDSAPAPQTTAQDADRTAITYTDLYEWGISGTANSADRRRALLARLGLPPRLSKKELLQVLNTLYTWESLDAQIEMME